MCLPGTANPPLLRRTLSDQPAKIVVATPARIIVAAYPELVERMSKINTYHTTLFSNYLDKLAAVQEGAGTLLDNMTILYGGGLSNSTIHSGVNLPVMLIGGGAGWLRGGRHQFLADEPTMADLHLSLLSKFGIEIQQLGGSTGPVVI